MLSKKKIIKFFLISLLLAFSICISFFNLIAEEPERGNFFASIVFVTVIAGAELGAYFFLNRVLSFFIFGYLVLLTLCFVIPNVFLALGGEYNAFVALCSMVLAPFYGFFYISKTWGIIAAIVLLLLDAVSVITTFDLIKRK